MRDTRDDLTARELEVLRLVASGLSDKLIGGRLGIAPSTVSNHLAVVFLKLHASNRAEAVAIAMRDGIINLSPPGVMVEASLITTPVQVTG